MSFHTPSVWLLLLLGLLPVIWWRRRGGRARAAVSFSTIAPALDAGGSWAARTRWIVPALRGAALVLLIVCVARPQKANERTRVVTEGIAIQLVVDRSGSMLVMDFAHEGRRVTRLDAVKRVVEDFVAGGDELPGRPDDLVGLIAFATHADTLSPLTLDHGYLVEAVRGTEVPRAREDQATAIGDAVGLAVERMTSLEDRPELRPIKSKVIVLLTDGEQNAGDLDPLTAARMAAAFGIRIYTIGAGTEEGVGRVPWLNPLTGKAELVRMQARIDEATLQEIAGITGGRYFRASDGETLEQVYATIDELERTEIEQRRYTDHKEITVEGVTLAGVPLPPLLAVVLVLLGAEIVLDNTRLRRVP